MVFANELAVLVVYMESIIPRWSAADNADAFVKSKETLLFLKIEFEQTFLPVVVPAAR